MCLVEMLFCKRTNEALKHLLKGNRDEIWKKRLDNL